MRIQQKFQKTCILAIHEELDRGVNVERVHLDLESCIREHVVEEQLKYAAITEGYQKIPRSTRPSAVHRRDNNGDGDEDGPGGPGPRTVHAFTGIYRDMYVI